MKQLRFMRLQSKRLFKVRGYDVVSENGCKGGG